ncbi:rCG40143, partial [Rattus norvegicus]
MASWAMGYTSTFLYGETKYCLSKFQLLYNKNCID